MSIDKKVIECELEYTKCFSEFVEDGDIVRFRDNQLMDMYYHNFTYIHNSKEETNLKQIIEKEVEFRISEESNYCNILLDDVVSDSFSISDKYKPEISTKGFYSLDISSADKLSMIPGCEIKRVVNQAMLDDRLFCDLQNDEKILGKDFCTRRCYRRGQVYLSEEGVNSYVCYHEGNVIGNCDLFIYNDVAKIEDFSVLDKYQRKGYGTTILKALIDIALKAGCKTIYLNTYEDETAKEMYMKNNFYKIGESCDLSFRF